MKTKPTCKKILSILLVLSLILLPACGKKSSGQSSSKSDPESEKVPSDLTELENNIELIEKTLGGPSVQANQESQQSSQSSQQGQPSSKQEGQSSQQGQSSSQQEGQSSQQGQPSSQQEGQSSQQGQPSSQQEGQSSQQGQSSSQQEGQSSQQGQSSSQSSSSGMTDPMEEVPLIVEKMHYQWNDLMPLAIKKGAKNDLINNFDNALNNLSSTVNSKDKMKTLLSANSVYAYIPDLYSLFDAKSSPQIKRVRYYSRSAILNALTANWGQSDSDITNLKSVWALYKNGISKDQLEIANKLDLSIYELEKVVKERNAQLASLKGQVELSNTEALEKASENESGGQSSSQQSSGQQSSS